MKTLSLNLRRVRSSVRTDVSTGSRKAQSANAGYPPSAGLPPPPAGNPPVPVGIAYAAPARAAY